MSTKKEKSTRTPPKRKVTLHHMQKTLQQSIVHCYGVLRAEYKEEGICRTETALIQRVAHLMGYEQIILASGYFKNIARFHMRLILLLLASVNQIFLHYPKMRSFLHIAIGVLLTPVVMANGAVKVEAVTSSTVIGEGPHWDHEQQVLYFVDIFGSEVRRYVPSTKQETKVLIEGGRKPVSLVVPLKGHKNKFIISIGRDLAILTWDGLSDTPTNIERIATVDDEEGRRENRLNDGKADPTGRLWAGTMGAKKGPGQFVMNNGALFSLSKNRTIKSHLQEISCSNGLTWSVDGRLMYYTDTFTWRVDVMDFDPKKGEVSNRRTFFDFKANGIKGHPDGMTTDTKGRLYFPCFGGSQVIVVDPNGKLVNTIPIPAFRVTSVAFGGKNLDELYVTTATEDVDDEEREKYPLGGCTFRVTGLDAKGFPGQPVVIDL